MTSYKCAGCCRL